MKRTAFCYLLPCLTILFLLSCSKGSERHNGYTFIDLGLSVKWATYNIGATSPEESGDYYAWGETDIKDFYSWDNYKYTANNKSSDNNILCTKYNNPQDPNNDKIFNILDQGDDIAQQVIGEGCRMPTHAEWKELMYYCIWEWTYYKGVKGYKITSDVPGYRDNFIFLPVTGEKRKGDLKDIQEGRYWSNENAEGDKAFIAAFESDKYNVIFDDRYIGKPVRAVIPSDNWSIKLSDYQNTVDLDNSELLRAYNNHGMEIERNDFFINWSSDNPAVAKIMKNGSVTGIAPGTATITATTYNYETKHQIEVTAPKYESKKENGHDYVDLGLSVNWATLNIGASRSWETGDSFAWGETETKPTYTQDNYKYYQGREKLGKYEVIANLTKYIPSRTYGTPDNKTKLDSEDDVAHLVWGGDWRMPTQNEWKELFSNTFIRKLNLNGILAFELKSKKQGYKDRYIIIPTNIPYEGHLNYTANHQYWTSTIGTSIAAYAAGFKYIDSEYSVDILTEECARHTGLFIRPVCKW